MSLKCPQTAADLPTDHIDIIRFLYRRLVGTCEYHAIITKDEKTCLGEWLETVITPLNHKPGCAACDRGDFQLGHHHDCPNDKP